MTEERKKYQREWKRKKRLDSTFKEKEKESGKKYHLKNREKRIAYLRKYHEENRLRGFCSKCGNKKENKKRRFCDSCSLIYLKPKQNKQTKEYLQQYYAKRASLKLCRGCGKPREKGRQYCDICRQLQSHYHHDKIRILKEIVYNHYGSFCSCCGETESAFLSIEHKKGWRETHKTKTRLTSQALYRWIIENSFPDCIEILCMNCNFAKRKQKECPHQSAVRALIGSASAETEACLKSYQDGKEVTVLGERSS